MSDGSVQSDKPCRILFVVNVDWFFISHRLVLARAAVERGWDVHVATGVTAPDNERVIRDASVQLHRLPDIRVRRSLLTDLRFTLHVARLIRKLRPEILHLVTVKPIIYGGILARLLAGNAAVVSAIPGLGYAFVARGWWSRLRRRLLKLGYSIALKNPRQRVVFQNREDLQLFVSEGIAPERATVLIPGAGVDMHEFVATPEPAGPVRVVMAARLLREKGVDEFLQAARLLRERHVPADFWLVGDLDPGNPGSMTRSELRAALEGSPVQWHGHRRDMQRVFAESHIVCLPTYYGEGVPKVLIEAAASARACVTTDTPGCRDVVRHGVNGLVVPPRDAPALAAALAGLIADPDQRRQFGRAGREIAQREFSLESVLAETLAMYAQIRSYNVGRT